MTQCTQIYGDDADASVAEILEITGTGRLAMDERKTGGGPEQIGQTVLEPLANRICCNEMR